MSEPRPRSTYRDDSNVGSPVLTVRSGASKSTFAAGHDVVVGRDLRADLRITHPSVSRVHLVLRFSYGRWAAIDNDSLNGTFINGERAAVVEIHDGQSINIGSPDGPQLTFEVGRHLGMAGRPPKTESMNASPGAYPSVADPGAARRPPNSASPGWQPHPGTPGHSRPPMYPTGATGQRPAYPYGPFAPAPNLQRHPQKPGVGSWESAPHTQMSPAAVAPPEASNLATKVFQALLPSRPGASPKPAGAQTIGRATDNDIIVRDVLASRHHAFLLQTPLGTEIRDAHSANGTFVNGVRVGSAVLTEGDVVTIGNVDLIYTRGTLVRRGEAATRTGGLEVNGVHFTAEGKELIDNISLTCRPGTLTAVIGGSGAGKTTLVRMIAGYTHPSRGSVTFEGHDIHNEYAVLRSRIGMVPQDDVVHHQLTVNQALGYAAELRLPPDTSTQDRAQIVVQVIEELDLTKNANTRVDKLSGGQRKRASVALELLTGPSLLILDEPTTGLDPALDRQVMLMLRRLADAGRTVLVVTHSVSYLDVCDQLLLIAPGGKTAFGGPPDQVETAMGTKNWADIFAKVGADPDEANRRFLAANKSPSIVASPSSPAADLGEPVHTDVLRQMSTIARRQVRLVVSDRGYSVFLALLPFLIGVLSLTVRGKTGLGIADPRGNNPDQPGQILVMLNVGAIFMGSALTIRDLVGERPIFQREQAVGLSTKAYLGAKVVVFCGFAIVQAAIATLITVVGWGAPPTDGVLLGNVSLELFVTVAATCVASAILGLALSAVAQSQDQIMPLLVVSIMSQLVFSGGMIWVTDRIVLDQLSWATPARWGYAASASTINIDKLVPGPTSPKDQHWAHKPSAWLFDMAMLGALCILYGGIVWSKIRLKRR
ncbi:ABC transporter ATP-binding protein [Mycobacterium malmoense]|nr:ATP-binding cassette domain-containing protein [Mycobacterium malmoense]OCB54765.1 ABC transporter ATP-binding protein [Mycobacterium malmoense]